jgi:hypothetical protein
VEGVRRNEPGAARQVVSECGRPRASSDRERTGRRGDQRGTVAAIELADVVLFHEVAHLAKGDPRRFARIEAVVDVSRFALTVFFWAIASVVGWMLAHAITYDVLDGRGAATMLRHATMVLAIGGLACASVPLIYLAVRRYAGFLTLLVELRADVTAALWGPGLTQMAQIVQDDEAVHKSSWADRGRSLFAIGPTHLSETERVAILENHDRLITPQLRYFGLSLALPLAFPLNGATPMLWAGTFDAVFALIATTAAGLSVVALPAIAATYGVRVRSALRIAALAIVLVALPALSHLNLYTFAYGVQSIATEIGMSAAGDDVDTPLGAFVSSCSDVVKQLGEAAGNGAIVAAVVLTFVVLLLLTSTLRRVSRVGLSSKVVLSAVISATALGLVVEGFDSSRAYGLEALLLRTLSAPWSAVVSRVPELRFTAGPLLALAVALLALCFASTISKEAASSRGLPRVDL